MTLYMPKQKSTTAPPSVTTDDAPPLGKFLLYLTIGKPPAGGTSCTRATRRTQPTVSVCRQICCAPCRRTVPAMARQASSWCARSPAASGSPRPPPVSRVCGRNKGHWGALNHKKKKKLNFPWVVPRFIFNNHVLDPYYSSAARSTSRGCAPRPCPPDPRGGGGQWAEPPPWRASAVLQPLTWEG